jgi:hypothetical protein
MISEPKTTAQAIRLQERSKLNRDRFDAECEADVAREFLALTHEPEKGSGGEFKPPTEIKEAKPGLADTMANPSRVTVQSSIDRINLADKAGILDLAMDMADTIKAENSLEKSLSHLLAAAHVQVMKLLTESNSQKSVIDQVRLTNAAARMMTAFNEGTATLTKLRSGGQQRMTVVHQHVQVSGGQVAVAGTVDKNK